MKILKPQKIFLENLIKLENIEKEVKDDENVENRLLEECSSENFELYNAKIETSIFKNVEIINGKMIKNEFKDVIFEKCNFSNTNFENCCFITETQTMFSIK